MEAYSEFCIFSGTRLVVHLPTLPDGFTGPPKQAEKVLKFSQKQQLLLHRTHSLWWPGKGAGRQTELLTRSSNREGETHSFNVGPLMHIVLFV